MTSPAPGDGTQAEATALDYPADEAAMRAIQSGHLDMLGVLYERHSRRVFARCHGMVGDPSIADDLVQETFLRALRYRASFRGEARVSTWLYRIASNVCLDYLQKRDRQAATESDAAAAAANEDIDPPASENERVAVLRSALDRLSPDKRQLLLMCRLDGLSYAQMAERLGVREGTIRVRVHRAVNQLKAIFDSLWEDTP